MGQNKTNPRGQYYPPPRPDRVINNKSNILCNLTVFTSIIQKNFSVPAQEAQGYAAALEILFFIH